jgi:DNA-binding response OmpR family regulator
MAVPRILVIEDEESILMGLEDDLRLEGYEVSGVSDGAEGLARASQ